MKKKQVYSDRIKTSKNKVLGINSEYNSKNNLKEIDNPFNKVIDRHYGSFKCKLLGDYKKVFNSLSINSIRPLGRYGTTKRKLLRTGKFTAVFYSNGTVELKIARASKFHKRAIADVQASHWLGARAAKAHLEKFLSLTLSVPVLNRVAKYGVEDSAARGVNLEIQGKKRKMDASTRMIAGRVVRRVSHVDNFGAVACEADSRLSSREHDLISDEIALSQGFKNKKSFGFRKAKGIARLQAPELLISIENALIGLGEAQREGAENIRFFGENMKAHVAAVEKLAMAADRIAPKKKRMPTNFKKSATLRGCH